MKITLLSILLLLSTSLISCKTEDDPIPEPTASDQAELIQLDLEISRSTFSTEISGTTISLTRLLPFGTNEVRIKTLALSTEATADKQVGDLLQIDQNPITITVTAEDGTTQQAYQVQLDVAEFASAVARHGRLQVSGNKIVDKNDEVVSFAGNSFFWSNDNWGGERFYRPEVVSWLKLDWGATIVRASMGVEDDGGYLDNKIGNKNKLKVIVDAAIAEGLYVIIDWHSHHAEDHPDEAVAFFEEMATLYGEHAHVIYELYNEPLNVSWSNTIKPYAERVIAAIRAIDPDNLIVVGTPEWSQRVDYAAADPISDPNIAYTLHFYTVYHQQWLRDRASAALAQGIALFVTEWGSIGYTQNDPETDLWMAWCADNDISHCNWAVNDKEEEWSIVRPGASTAGEWTDFNLSDAGVLARRIIRNWSNK